MPDKAECHLFFLSKSPLDISIILPITSGLHRAPGHFWSPENDREMMAREAVITRFPCAIKCDGWDLLAWRQPAKNECELLGARAWHPHGWSTLPSGVANHPWRGYVSLPRPRRDPKCDTHLSLGQLDPRVGAGAPSRPKAGWKGGGGISTTKSW